MRKLVALFATALLGACTALAPPAVTEVSLPTTPGGNGPTAPIVPQSGPGQTFAQAPVDASWWTMFGNATLNSLVARAITANNDIAAADAALKQAREQALAAGGSQWPTLDVGYQAQRARTSNVLATPLADPNATNYSLHTAQVTVGYTLDVFGGVHNKIVSARAAANVARFRFQAARTTVIANLVLAVVQNASLSAQIDAASRNIAANAQVLEMLRARQKLGAVGALDVSAQETALAAAEAQRPPLVRAQAHTQAQIAALLGIAPGQPLPELPRLEELSLPATLPLALPSDLIAQRPDVRAAKAQMEGAAADVGSAIAARLPTIQLSAAAGGSATNFSDMFAPGEPFWSLIGGLTQPLFHGGALKHQQRASEAALAGTKAQYRAAVLQAFVDVSDALTALKTDADLLDATTRAQTAADRTRRYVSRQLELGDAGTFALQTAEAADAQAQSALIQARTARLNDSVALIQALGGGWDAKAN